MSPDTPPPVVARATPTAEHMRTAMRELDAALQDPECVKRLRRAIDTARIPMPPKEAHK